MKITSLRLRPTSAQFLYLINFFLLHNSYLDMASYDESHFGIPPISEGGTSISEGEEITIPPPSETNTEGPGLGPYGMILKELW